MEVSFRAVGTIYRAVGRYVAWLSKSRASDWSHREVAPFAWENASNTVAAYVGLPRQRELQMILRMWRGWTSLDDTERYADYILGTGITEYEATPGNRGAYIVSRTDGDRSEFLTISLWDDLDSIVGFAGDDIEQAVFYPEDDKYLVDRETTVSHFVVHERGRATAF